ncbi:hypothetical protein AMR72_08150 [Flavobacterium psychrophilum]|nr:hypothetical protein AMR72_08150 [Flavobacterium psychrophilum]AOE52479.1 hypothetical protein ALW18_08140 [Flavobacterium psychrophilum]
MKKVILLLASVILFSCGDGAAEKPKRFLTEDEMVNISYDLSLIQAIKSYQPQALDDNKVDSKNYIYKKYKIDSLTFAQNNTWYAGNLEQYEKIQQRVTEKLNKQKEILAPKKDSLTPPVTDVPGAQARRDSVRKAALGKRQPLKK